MDFPTFDLPGAFGPTELIFAGIPIAMAVITWLLFGVTSAVVATNKGRNGCGWFTLGFLLGPVGLILAFVVAKDQAALERRLVLRGEMQHCPYCAELIRAEAIKCRYCGENIGEDQTSSHAPYMPRPGR